MNCSVDDLMSIFAGDNTVREECVQLEEFEDRFQVLSIEEQDLIEKRDHASFTSDYVNGMFNELNEIGQARFFAEEGQYIGNDALLIQLLPDFMYGILKQTEEEQLMNSSLN